MEKEKYLFHIHHHIALALLYPCVFEIE